MPQPHATLPRSNASSLPASGARRAWPVVPVPSRTVPELAPPECRAAARTSPRPGSAQTRAPAPPRIGDCAWLPQSRIARVGSKRRLGDRGLFGGLRAVGCRLRLRGAQNHAPTGWLAHRSLSTVYVPHGSGVMGEQIAAWPVPSIVVSGVAVEPDDETPAPPICRDVHHDDAVCRRRVVSMLFVPGIRVRPDYTDPLVTVSSSADEGRSLRFRCVGWMVSRHANRIARPEAP